MGPWAPVSTEAAAWAGGSGAVWTTPTDLLKWSLALMEGPLLSSASRSLMTTNTRLPGGRGVGYGCGLSIGERQGYVIWSHIGVMSGFFAWHAILPATRSAVVIVANAEFLSAATLPIGRAVLNMLTPPAAAPISVSGPTATEAAAAMMAQLQSGKVERSRLGKLFGAWLTDGRLATLTAFLAPLGSAPPELAFSETRGGMEHSLVRFRFPKLTVGVEMFRSADGTIEQFLTFRD
jgi:hypothetical protein